MAREPEPRVRAEDFQKPYEEPDAAEHHRITNGVAAALIGWAIVLDVADYFGAGEVLITDALCVLTIDIYLIKKGFSPLRMFGAQALEALPLVGDILPGYIAGVAFTIAQDRSAAVAAVAQRIPAPKPGARIAGTATQASSRVRQYAQKTINAVQKGAQKVQDAQKLLDRVPGPVRSIPGQVNVSATQGSPAQGGVTVAHGFSRRNLAPSPNVSTTFAGQQQSGDLPFPDTYYRYEKEMNPDLEDIIESQIDVSGAQAVQAAAKRAAGGPAAQNRVQ